MDLNDIRQRLELLAVSLKRQNKPPSTTHRERPVAGSPDKTDIIVRFGTRSQPELVSDVNSLLGEFAALKDIIGRRLKDLGRDPQLIEDLMNRSLHLQLMLDLNNEVKHGYPLRRYRSGVQPVISELGEGLHVPAGTKLEVEIDVPSMATTVGPGPFVTVTGRIRTRDGKEICTLGKLVDSCLEAYEGFIRDQGLADEIPKISRK
jgi:hypothetical protein